MRAPVLVILLLFGSLSTARSADIYPFSQKSCTVQILGPIEKGDDEKFFRLVVNLYMERDCHAYDVDLISEGGDLRTAMNLGYQLRALHASTAAPARSWPGPLAACKIRKPGAEEKAKLDARCKCASACFFIWAGGSKRYGGESVQIHRPYYDPEQYRDVSGNDAFAAYEALVRGSKAYLEEMGIPNSIVDRMFSINSQDASLLTPREVEQTRTAPYFDEMIIANCGPEPSVNGPAGSAERRKQIEQLDAFLKCGHSVQDRLARQSFRPYVEKFGKLLIGP